LAVVSLTGSRHSTLVQLVGESDGNDLTYADHYDELILSRSGLHIAHNLFHSVRSCFLWRGLDRRLGPAVASRDGSGSMVAIVELHETGAEVTEGRSSVLRSRCQSSRWT
jgi:hypothetical protein